MERDVSVYFNAVMSQKKYQDYLSMKLLEQHMSINNDLIKSGKYTKQIIDEQNACENKNKGKKTDDIKLFELG